MVNFEMVKVVGNLVGSVAGGSTVGIIVKQFIPASASALQKAEMIVGGTLIGGVVGIECGKYAEQMIVNIEQFVKGKTEENKLED